MSDETKKLREEMERWWEDYQAADDLGKSIDNCHRGHMLLRDNRQAILAALRTAEALPVTADGVPITPGMNIYQIEHDKPAVFLVSRIYKKEPAIGAWRAISCGRILEWFFSGVVYSTAESALASQPAPPAANSKEQAHD